MTGVDSWSPTANTNDTTEGGNVTWAEQQFPSTVNDSARKVLAALRAWFNDMPWFQYGTGDQNTATHLAVPAVYSSATAFTISGADVTAAYHAGRPVRAVGATTGTIYGFISSSSYSAPTTTVNVAWNTGSLQSETLVISIGLPALSMPATTVKRVVELVVSDPQGSGITTGDSKTYTRIPSLYNGYNLISVAASLFVASSSGIPTIQLHRVRAGVSVDMLSTKLTIDANEVDSSTAATPAVINTSNDDLATGDQIHVDIDVAGTTATGLNVQLTYGPGT